MKSNKKDKPYVWSKGRHDVFEDFAVDIQNFWKNGSVPQGAGRLLRQSLEIQRDRMNKMGLRMTYDFKPNGQFDEKPIRQGWKDGIYTNDLEIRTCELTRTIFKDGKSVYKDRENVNLSMVITNVRHKEQALNEIQSCPSCGGVSTLRQLEEMCPYCHTRFTMTDLFPKVTNYYAEKALGGTEKEIGRQIRKTQLVVGLVFALYLTIKAIIAPSGEGLLTQILDVVVGSILAGGIFGYLLFNLFVLGMAFKETGRSMPLIFATMGSSRRFEKTVKKYSPEFSTVYFRDKAVTILKQLLSEDDMTDNPYYVGDSVKLNSDVIIESVYRNGIGIRNCRVSDGYCTVNVDLFMTDFYYIDNKIKKKDDRFRMTMAKNLKADMNYHFSIAAVKCKSCGGSFDAGRTKHCPYCGVKYEIGDNDWVVTDIRKVR